MGIHALIGMFCGWNGSHARQAIQLLATLLYSPLGRGYLTGKIDENTTYDSTDIRA